MTTAAPPPPVRPRRWPRALSLTALVLGVGAAAFLAGYLLMALIFFPGFNRDAIVAVPELRGKSLSAARRLVERSGLELERGNALVHPRVPAGAVLAQSPLPGAEITRGASVRVILSAGHDRRAVPDLSNVAPQRVPTVLRNMGFVVQVRAVENERPAGVLLNVSPSPGTVLELPAAVRLTVSAGPPLVSVPSVISLPEPEARERIAAAGLRLGSVRYDPDAAEPLGGIAGQDPAPGQSVRQGSAVSVVVSGVDPTPPPPTPLGIPVDSARAEAGDSSRADRGAGV